MSGLYGDQKVELIVDEYEGLVQMSSENCEGVVYGDGERGRSDQTMNERQM